MTTSQAIHLGSRLDPTTLDSLADFICGDGERFPMYRTGSNLTRFFQSTGINVVHDGSTRKWWTLETLKQLQLQGLEKVILRLVDIKEYKSDQDLLRVAVNVMNKILLVENLQVSFEGIQPILKRPEKAPSINLERLLRQKPAKSEAEFLKKQFDDDILIDTLIIDSVIAPILQSRVDEALACPRNKVPLGTIFLLGSTLEGLLLAVATQNNSKFIASPSTPKDKNGKVISIHNWGLCELIDVAYDVGFIGLDVKKFGHVLRDFRNYIHPYRQMSQNFNPDQHTVDICWQVFKAAFYDLKKPFNKTEGL